MSPANAPSFLLSDEDISFVGSLVKEAGKLAQSMREGVGIQEKTGPHDRVTEADIALSKLLSEQLKSRFPQDLIISEEDNHPEKYATVPRTWMIDPIDGTDNYIRNDGQYAVMVGIIVDFQAVFGWVYAPAFDTLYLGGPSYGAWKQTGNQHPVQYAQTPELQNSGPRRLMMGFRDRKTHPWVLEMPDVHFVKAGSVGLKVARVLHDEADMFIHLSGKLKMWDTAAPAAIALGAGMEVGCLDSDQLTFDLPHIQHYGSIIMGRKGSIAWSKDNLQKSL